MESYYEDDLRVIYHGDCREVLSEIYGVSAVVTDPPYELKFMGKKWDGSGVSFDPETWKVVQGACLPGVPMLSFGGTRTQHRIACAIEDAGWELRDVVMWVYGSGFPKSMNVALAIDKQLGLQTDRGSAFRTAGAGDRVDIQGKNGKHGMSYTDPKSDDGKEWDGWGTALKPAYEPIILAMNPLEKTLAQNALKYGIAGLNIDGCRIPAEGGRGRPPRTSNAIYGGGKGTNLTASLNNALGRWPANLIHDGSDEVLALFPNSNGQQRTTGKRKQDAVYGKVSNDGEGVAPRGDNGSAARFFYCAKASRSERDAGLADMSVHSAGAITGGRVDGSAGRTSGGRNNHPTVKPIALMEYLCRLVSMPQYNLILDPFCGSGTTLLACGNLGLRSIGIDSDEQSCEIAANRCAADVVARIQRGEYDG